MKYKINRAQTVDKVAKPCLVVGAIINRPKYCKTMQAGIYVNNKATKKQL